MLSGSSRLQDAGVNPPPPFESVHVSPLNGGGGAIAPRTAALGAKVNAAKAVRLTCAEHLCTLLGCLTTLPTLGLSGLRIVP